MKVLLKKVIIIAVIYIITAIFNLYSNCYLKVSSIVCASDLNRYEILVDVEESKLYLFENGNVIKEYKCSGGKKNTPSPIGTWKITKKAKWGEGFGRIFYGT